MHRQTLQSHWFRGSAYTCGLMEMLTVLTTAEVKKGFKVPAKWELATHLRWVGWPEPWHADRAAYTPDLPLHTYAVNGQCNWVKQFYHRCSVLYGRFVMHHPAYIKFSVPIVRRPKHFLPEPSSSKQPRTVSHSLCTTFSRSRRTKQVLKDIYMCACVCVCFFFFFFFNLRGNCCLCTFNNNVVVPKLIAEIGKHLQKGEMWAARQYEKF